MVYPHSYKWNHLFLLAILLPLCGVHHYNIYIAIDRIYSHAKLKSDKLSYSYNHPFFGVAKFSHLIIFPKRAYFLNGKRHIGGSMCLLLSWWHGPWCNGCPFQLYGYWIEIESVFVVFSLHILRTFLLPHLLLLSSGKIALSRCVWDTFPSSDGNLQNLLEKGAIERKTKLCTS